MRTLIGLMAVISVGSLSTAFAMDPPSTSSTTTETAAAPATTTATATDGKSATDKPAATTVKLVAGDADADKQLKRLKAAGYKAEMRGDQVVFCRREAMLGSRFDRKVCNTAEVLEQQMQQAQDLTEKTQRMGMSQPRGN